MKTMTKELNINFTNINKTAIVLKAISYPQRLLIVSHLVNGQRLSVKEIQDLVELRQPVASHHLTILKNSGIITCNLEGKLNFILSMTQNPSTVESRNIIHYNKFTLEKTTLLIIRFKTEYINNFIQLSYPFCLSNSINKIRRFNKLTTKRKVASLIRILESTLNNIIMDMYGKKIRYNYY